MTKVTKTFAAYKNRNPGKWQRCDRCAHLLSPFACSMVKGLIDPCGICRYFEQRRKHHGDAETTGGRSEAA